MFHFEFFHQAATDAGLTSPESPRVVCKPSAAAYDLVFKRLGVRPEEALFFDDSVRNIRGAHDLGIMTVLVSALVPGLLKGGYMTRPHSKKLYSNRLHS